MSIPLRSPKGLAPGTNVLDEDYETIAVTNDCIPRTDWSTEAEFDMGILGTTGFGAAVAVTLSGEQLFVASRTKAGTIQVRSAQFDSSASTFTSYSTITSFPLPQLSEPEVATYYVNTPSGPHVAIAVAMASVGTYWWATNPLDGSDWTLRQIVDESGAPVVATHLSPLRPGLAPAIASWPYEQLLSQVPITPTTCGIFVSRPKQATEFRCYDRDIDAWRLQPCAFASITCLFGKFGPPSGPTTISRPALRFHALRDSASNPNGGDPTRGEFWFIATPPSHSTGQVFLSTRMSLTEGPTTGLQFRSMNDFGNTIQGNVALYEDATLSSLKGLAIESGESGWFAAFYPFVDGTFKATLRNVNDYHVIERGICRGLHGAHSPDCGPPNVWGF